MSDLDRAQRELDELVAEGQALARREESTSTDLVVSGGAEATKAELERLQTQAKRHAVMMQAKAAEVRALAATEAERMKAIERRAQAAVEPIEAMLKQLNEGLKTIGLYLGTGEQIIELRDGEPAPAETPVTIRQMVLRMDEECAVAVEQGGIDSRNFSQFDKWLLEDPAHVQQVIPEPKGVVCLTPRDPARSKDTGNKHGDAAAQQENKQTYWLIRNGEKLYRTVADFIVGDKLVPSPDEFDRLFYEEERDWSSGERTRKAIKPGSSAWEKAQQNVESSERHFYRVALVLEGLLHRTPVFHPAPHDLSFLDPAAHEAGRVKFILDMEAALGDGHEQFSDYLKRLNAQLRPGMRIVGTFTGRYERDGFGAHSDRSDSWRHRRLAPETASWPEDGVIYDLERVQGNRLGFKYERTDEVYVPRYGRDGRWIGSKMPERRASCAVKPEDDWIIPYDLVSADELRRFLSYRTDRRSYLSMFPLIKAVICAKGYEAQLERPFREMLAGVLARENGVSVYAAQEAVPELVDWFKTSNRWHRPLVAEMPPEPDFSDADTAGGRRRSTAPSDAAMQRARDRWHRDMKLAQEAAAKAVRLITAEHARRVRIARRKPDEKLVAELGRAYPSAVLVARRRSDGKYIVVVPERSDEEVWAQIVTWGPRKGLEADDRWQLISKAQAARWQPLTVHERWDRWDHEADESRHLTDPEVASLLERAIKAAETTDEPAPRRRKKAGGDDPVKAGKVLAVTRSGMRLSAWVLEAEPVLPHPTLPLTHDAEAEGEKASRGQLAERRFRAVRRPDGLVSLRAGDDRSARWTDSFMGRDRGAQRKSLWKRSDQVLWQDRDALHALRAKLDEYDRRREYGNGLSNECYKFTRAITEQWEARWWEQQRLAWVAEYGKPELWEGQRKIIESKQRRSHDGLEAPLDGLRGLVAPFVERGESERLWGRLVADVLNEAQGRGWMPLEDEEPQLDESLLGLRFINPEPEPEEEPEEEPVDSDAWDQQDSDLFDGEGTIAVAGELEAGDVVDATVVDEG